MPQNQKPRLATPNPLNPGAYNRERYENRMISRSAGASAVRCLDEQANATIDERIEQVKAQARSRISKIAEGATAQIARLQQQKAQGAK